MAMPAPPGYHYDERGYLVADVDQGYGTGLRGNARRALDLQHAAGQGTNFPSNYQLTRTGELEKQPGVLLPAIATLAAPLAGAFLPALFGAGGAAGSGAATGAAAGGAGATGAATGAATAAATGGLSGALKGLVTNPSNLMDMAGLITALIGARSGGNGQASAEAQRMNQMTEERMRRVDPLHQAVTQLAWGRLPISARQGIAPPTYSPLPK